jgi:hypothetical protein
MLNLGRIAVGYRYDKTSWEIILETTDSPKCYWSDLLYNHTYVEAMMELWDISAEQFFDKLHI